MPNDDRTQVIYRRTPESAGGLVIAAGAIIIGGVTVGENSVVAAGSVVTKNVPPNTLVGGNPAKLIRSIDASERGATAPAERRTRI
jgi:acetyltransferase-like isoleucine patch superfamily enzyme